MESYAEDELEGETDEGRSAKAQERRKKKGWSLSMIVGVAVAGILSFIVGKLVFTVVPAAIEELIFGQSVLEYNSTQPD